MIKRSSLLFSFALFILIALLMGNATPKPSPEIEPIEIIQRMLLERDIPLKQMKRGRFAKEKFDRIREHWKSIDQWVITYERRPIECYQYIEGKAWKIIHTFSGARDSIEKYNVQKLYAAFGEPEKDLGSVGPKGFRELAYPSKGMAISANTVEGYFDQVVVFAPMTLEEYKEKIWRDPSQFEDGDY